MHLAAESHVDRSIDGPVAFIRPNVLSTQAQLQTARAPGHARRRGQGCLQLPPVSTDKVFGSLESRDDPSLDEPARYDPRGPCSASKAASDDPVRAWQYTCGLPAFVPNTTNNFGPWRFPQEAGGARSGRSDMPGSAWAQ